MCAALSEGSLACQLAWFHLLSAIGGGAANAALFMVYLAGILPWSAHGWYRLFVLTILIVIPAVANYIGVRSGARLANLLTVAKLLPLGLLIFLGLVGFGGQFELLHVSEVTAPGSASWLSALLLLIFAYGGYENALIPIGEVKEPRRTVPFGLLSGLLVCMLVYKLVQFVTVATIGVSATDRPLVETASILIGSSGRLFVTIAVMVSTYGWVSGGILNAPRLRVHCHHKVTARFFSGDCTRASPPAVAIVLYSALVWLLAASGTYLWAVALSGASMVIM